MDSQLFTLSKLFTERLFRIPDYQRGYAWTEAQWKDYWSDIEQIEEGGNHYTGVLTLELVPEKERSGWNDDRWIIDSKGYDPYYIVDGQQRITTSIIIIQSILDCIGEDGVINYTPVEEIRRKFIFDSKDKGISRSYIFGYDRDNPSYEFLKTRVFGEFSSSLTSSLEETIYTNNLEIAKAFFTKKLGDLSREKIEIIYKKITQGLLFNIFTISEEVDVCVAFETMNNRGKPLSYLELLKNRLIYLSLKINEVDSEKERLRVSINDCWKSIYHNLGRNKSRPLDDDLFLGTHYILYFLKVGSSGAVSDVESVSNLDDVVDPRLTIYNRRFLRLENSYTKLLKERFVQRRIYQPAGEGAVLGLHEIYEYVKSLQVAVKSWYQIFNPTSVERSEAESYWLDKLDRIGNQAFLPLILAVMRKIQRSQDRVQVLKAIERYIYVINLLEHSYIYYDYRFGFTAEAISLYNDNLTYKGLYAKISESTQSVISSKNFKTQMESNFRPNGYYAWSRIRYFLYEYNLDLQERSKTERRKLHWTEFSDESGDYKTVEHIYPQNARAAYWVERFKGLSSKQRDLLRNSLGNLVPLSQAKNSSLSNKPFPEKVEGKRDGVVGFRYGCYAENEISREVEWTPEQIKNRGLKMIKFMERRWTLNLGSDAEKMYLLNIEFLQSESPENSGKITDLA